MNATKEEVNKWLTRAEELLYKCGAEYPLTESDMHKLTKDIIIALDKKAGGENYIYELVTSLKSILRK